MNFDEGSFRDNAGRVIHHSNRIFRQVNKSGKERIDFFFKNDLYKKALENEYIIKSDILGKNDLKKYNFKEDSLIIEHEKIPYVSYPYEWSFYQLKEAALHHLNFHIYLLNNGATLIDSSAYNIQFIGSKPIFIDVLSVKEYKEGEYWYGHKQFCENFLNPLILSSKKGIQFNNWFKGNLEGIATEDLNKILNIFDKFSFNIFVHVYLLTKFENKYKNQNKKFDLNIKKKFPKKNFLSMLNQLKAFINKLEPKKSATVWETYSNLNTYDDNETKNKTNIVKNFFQKNKSLMIADLGCNDGYYSKIAIESGCEYVVGFDYDFNSINRAYKTFINSKNFLPLIFDASNPSTNIGWNEKERKSFFQRANFDCVLALAFQHHLTIAKNIPLEDVLSWIVALAPIGLIEFVPKNDETVQKMIKLKGDIFPNYNEENFKEFILKKATIVSEFQVTKSGRKIYEFERKN